ncbi:hypothetical protein AB0M95_27765 [Sphaerisporangium sp. NPDC051017]|uniref:hypothetical protein n=1 Tax=Sphaerisporangium sp. NPDC051017 TaxID=3154636 RepID=UPI00344A1F32
MKIRTLMPKAAPLTCAAVFGAFAVVACAVPAAAHPFGPPSTARISADGSHVTLSWMAAEDDWVALGQSVGAFEDPATGAVSTALTGEQKLSRSPAVRDYLLGRITVARNGRPCEARLEELRALLTEGARFGFDCDGPVTEVQVTLAALTDLNENYRTMLTAETPATPARTLFTKATATQRVRFSATAASTPAGVTGTVAGVGVVLVAGAGVLVARRVRRGGRA